MNRQDNSRIRLKVLTTTGINILCTAIKSQKVSQWLPHFEQAYRQVKEEQNDDLNSKMKFIRAIRIKKDDYHVAHSQVIGDVFQDNDEVFCDIAVPLSKKEAKAQKIKSKRKEGTKAALRKVQVIEEKSQEQQPQEENMGNRDDKVKPAFQQSKSKTKPTKKPKEEQSQHKPKPISTKKPTKTQLQGIQPPKSHPTVDISKLKTLLVRESPLKK